MSVIGPINMKELLVPLWTIIIVHGTVAQRQFSLYSLSSRPNHISDVAKWSKPGAYRPTIYGK